MARFRCFLTNIPPGVRSPMETGSIELSEKVQKILPDVADAVIKLPKDAGLEVTPK